VALRLPAEPDAKVSLRSTSGRVLSQFDRLRSAHGPAAHSVNGTLGRGSGHISVTTLSGRVTLLKRADPPPAQQPPAEQPAAPPRSESSAPESSADEPAESGNPWSAATDDAPTKGEAR
jgi:hypothetical protein